MKKLVLFCAMLSMVAGISTGCTDTENTPPVEESSAITAVDKEYTRLTFKDVPRKITDAYTSESRDVQITGYLSDSLSKDGSTGYLVVFGNGGRESALWQAFGVARRH